MKCWNFFILHYLQTRLRVFSGTRILKFSIIFCHFHLLPSAAGFKPSNLGSMADCSANCTTATTGQNQNIKMGQGKITLLLSARFHCLFIAIKRKRHSLHYAFNGNFIKIMYNSTFRNATPTETTALMYNIRG